MPVTGYTTACISQDSMMLGSYIWQVHVTKPDNNYAWYLVASVHRDLLDFVNSWPCDWKKLLAKDHSMYDHEPILQQIRYIGQIGETF